MVTNFIFTGFGHSAGKYSISNKDLFKAVRTGQLKGFNEDLVLHSKNYNEYLLKNPDSDPFEYFVGHKMGFYKRRHVTPWPPTREHQDMAQNSLDLLVEAVNMALNDADLQPESIDSWIVSTVSPHETAPGMAATLKCYFVNPENQSPAMTLTSGCAGFNKGIQRAIDHFKANPEVNNVMLAHTETMSHFLNENNNFVAHATFADAAAAIIISRKTALNSEGVINQVNYHDIKMIDSVGVDKNWNLYMDGGQVKKRAVINITNVSKEILEKTDWSLDDLDLVVPHQTGNAILHTVAQELSLPMEKLYQEAQHKYGNISGATIPLALSMLKHSGKLQEGMKILCPTAGVGGEYGAFSYIVPKASKKIKSENLPLKGKTALVLFSDSKLGVELCDKMLQLGCTVVAHSNQTNEWSMHLFQRQQSYPGLILNVETLNSAENANKWLEDNFANQSFDYQINLFSAKESIYGILDNNDVIQWSSLNQHLSRKLLSKTKSTCIILGHPSEFVTSLTTNPLSELFLGWQGLMGSMAGEAISKGVTTIWYTPGIYEKMTAYMDSNMKNACKSHLNQKYSGLITEIVDRIIKSLYLLKVKDTKDTHLGPLKHRVEQFAFRTACEGNK